MVAVTITQQHLNVVLVLRALSGIVRDDPLSLSGMTFMHSFIHSLTPHTLSCQAIRWCFGDIKLTTLGEKKDTGSKNNSWVFGVSGPMPCAKSFTGGSILS